MKGFVKRQKAISEAQKKLYAMVDEYMHENPELRQAKFLSLNQDWIKYVTLIGFSKNAVHLFTQAIANIHEAIKEGKIPGIKPGI